MESDQEPEPEPEPEPFPWSPGSSLQALFRFRSRLVGLGWVGDRSHQIKSVCAVKSFPVLSCPTCPLQVRCH